jgi:23S rRNA (guanine745-N1)-methyltransferase
MRDQDIALFTKMQDALACPLCARPLRVENQQAWVLICDARHTFNIAREGTVNLLTTHRQKASGYGADELAARRRMLQAGLFAPLTQGLAAILRDHAERLTAEPLRVADIGTGEGSLFAALIDEVSPTLPPIEGCGLDMSAAGIRMARKASPDKNILWFVANALRPLPFQDRAFHLLLSILAPLNPEEAARIVPPSGLVLVVLPGEEHFAEFRRAVFEHEREPRTSDARLLGELGARFTLQGTKRITHTSPVPAAAMDDLVYMTPLFWKASRGKLADLRDKGLDHITVDFNLHWFAAK